MKNEKFCSQWNIYFKRRVGFRSKGDFGTKELSDYAGENETTQENIQDWLELDEGDLRFQLVAQKKLLQ
jgi:hypothetical protein